MRVFDDFIPNAAAIRAHALASDFVDWPGHDGEVYKRVSLTDVPGLHKRIEEAMGPVDMLGMGYRLNFGGELPNAAVHSDIGWGTHALVLYLCEGEGGTAFWRHRATGAHEIEPGDFDLWQRVKDDFNDEAAWDQVGLCPIKFGRAVIYDSRLFHSRYPFAAFGTGPEDGRLVAVAFFSPRKA